MNASTHTDVLRGDGIKIGEVRETAAGFTAIECGIYNCGTFGTAEAARIAVRQAAEQRDKDRLSTRFHYRFAP